MKAFNAYKEYVAWYIIATTNEYEPQWMQDIGVELGKYLCDCITSGQRCTFDEFFEHLRRKAPKQEETK